MPRHMVIALLALCCAMPSSSLAEEVDLLNPPEEFIFELPAGADLQFVMDAAPNGAIIRLAAGDYEAKPEPYTDPLCGNCLEPDTPVQASTGFTLRGKSLTIEGPSEGVATLHTRAGYGFFIEDAPEVALIGLTITDGQRDKDGNATDGAVVVRNSKVTIEHCTLGPNPVPERLIDKVIVGICGAVGREDAELIIRDTIITNNTWDGVAFYRGSVGDLTNVEISHGRGAGIGITWDSVVQARRCQVSEYWKGIGSFGTSAANIENCLVRDLRGWGIVATGYSIMRAVNNTVVRCGNVGFALWNPEAKMELTNNISWGNGTAPQWVAPPVGLWWNGPADAPLVRHNLFGNNDGGEFLRGYGDTEDAGWSLAGQNGNILGHPLYRSDGDWINVRGNSPIIDAGDPTIRDRDGSVSDLGWTGGPGGV